MKRIIYLQDFFCNTIRGIFHFSNNKAVLSLFNNLTSLEYNCTGSRFIKHF